MTNKNKSFVFSVLVLFLSALPVKAHELDSLCDSVFRAVQEKSISKLRELIPSYKDLKGVYDSSDLDMMNYQIGIRQQELRYHTKRDMKRIKKYARRNKIQLDKLEKMESAAPKATDEEGHQYAHSFVKCQYRKRQFKIHFVLIELNGNWFYGEGLRIEELEVIEEETPDYEKIDRELMRKREERERERLKAIEADKQAEEDILREQEKEEERMLREQEKKKREEAAEKKRQEREAEKERKRKEREALKKKKQEERERIKREREEERKKREEEKKRKEEEKNRKEKKD